MRLFLAQCSVRLRTITYPNSQFNIKNTTQRDPINEFFTDVLWPGLTHCHYTASLLIINICTVYAYKKAKHGPKLKK
jgi:hypothetical protein